MPDKSRRRDFWKFLLSLILSAVFTPAVLLLLSGVRGWTEGWIFSLWFDAMVLSNMIYLYTKNPGLLAERSKLPGSGNQQHWDKYLQSFAYLAALCWFLIMPLDAKRFSWSPAFSPWLKIAGGALLIPAIYFIFMATAENTFLSSRVRIQSDRGHYVVSTGVYGIVRHPLYLGCLLMLTGGPLLLGSVYGLAVGAVATLALAVRSIGEERMLKAGLEGYIDYTKKVKYRLIPFIW